MHLRVTFCRPSLVTRLQLASAFPCLRPASAEQNFKYPITKMTTIGIAGLSGRLGFRVAQRILQRPNTKIHGFCRSASRIDESLRRDPNVTITEGDAFDLRAVRTALRGCEAVVCTYLGRFDVMIDAQKVLIDACIAENVPRYIASDYTLDYTKIGALDIPSKEPMHRIVDYLQGKPVKGVHVMIGAFVETFWTFLGVWRPKEYSMIFWGDGTEKWDFTTYDNCAEYVAEVALDRSATGFLRCTSPYQRAFLT